MRAVAPRNSASPEAEQPRFFLARRGGCGAGRRRALALHNKPDLELLPHRTAFGPVEVVVFGAVPPGLGEDATWGCVRKVGGGI